MLSEYRTFEDYEGKNNRNYCGGTGPYDNNDGVTYEQGVHDGSSGVLNILTDTAKNWTTDQWVGYFIHNITTGKGKIIVSNTAETITGTKNAHTGGDLIWNPGDEYIILRAYPCLDQVGHSTGDLLSGDPAQPLAWPNQSLEPFYEWNNTINGEDADARGREPVILEGRDFYNDTPRPGYTPYTYPHPFTTSGFTAGDLTEVISPTPSPDPIIQPEPVIDSSDDVVDDIVVDDPVVDDNSDTDPIVVDTDQSNLDDDTNEPDIDTNDENVEQEEEFTAIKQDDRPDGTLVKYRDNPTVYVIEDGVKRPIPSFDLLRRRFGDQPIATIASDEIYSDGSPLTYSTGALLKTPGSNQVYLVLNDGSIYPFRSREEFEQFGYRFQMIRVIDQVQLSDYQQSLFSSLGHFHANDTFIKYPDSPTVYRIRDRKKQGIPSWEVFLSNADPEDIVEVDRSFVYDDEPELLTYPDGSIIKPRSGNTVYIIEGGQRRAFRSSQSFLEQGYSFNQVREVNDGDLLLNGEGESVE